MMLAYSFTSPGLHLQIYAKSRDYNSAEAKTD